MQIFSLCLLFTVAFYKFGKLAFDRLRYSRKASIVIQMPSNMLDGVRDHNPRWRSVGVFLSRLVTETVTRKRFFWRTFSDFNGIPDESFERKLKHS